MLHPDKFSIAKEESDLPKNATFVSSFCSNAYKILQNDITRAQYILKSEHNIESLEEGEREKDPDVMEWVFETRMEIDEIEDELELSAMQM